MPHTPFQNICVCLHWLSASIFMHRLNDPLTLDFKGEMAGQMSTLMVSSQQKEGVWVPHFQTPEIQNTLSSPNHQESHHHNNKQRWLTSIEK